LIVPAPESVESFFVPHFQAIPKRTEIAHASALTAESHRKGKFRECRLDDVKKICLKINL